MWDLSRKECTVVVPDRVWMCRYADTVIYRIMYKMDRLGSGQLHLRDLKRQAVLLYFSFLWLTNTYDLCATSSHFMRLLK